jgi:hypothetical protein
LGTIAGKIEAELYESVLRFAKVSPQKDHFTAGPIKRVSSTGPPGINNRGLERSTCARNWYCGRISGAIGF